MSNEKNEEEPNVFDEIEGNTMVEEETSEVPLEEMAGDPDEQLQPLSAEDFSEIAPADKPKKINLDGKSVTISKVDFTRARKSDFRTGKTIEPIEADSGALYYRAKMVLTLDTSALKLEENAKNVVEYIPNVKYFVNDGVITRVPKIPRQGESQVAKLFRMYAKTIGKDLEEISDKDFIQGLVGTKVKLKVESGKYKGNDWFRNNIVAIVK